MANSVPVPGVDEAFLGLLVAEQRVLDNYRQALGMRLSVTRLYRKKRGRAWQLTQPGWIYAVANSPYRVEVVATPRCELLRMHGNHLSPRYRVRLLGGPSPLRRYDLFVSGPPIPKDRGLPN